MKKVHILVEGQTEDTFVRDVLYPHFSSRGIFVQTKLCVTKRVKAGGHFKGGVVSYEQVRGDVRRLLLDTSAVLVTTMLDYYGLPPNFPGQDDRPHTDCYARVRHVEDAFARNIDDPRFLPHLMLHEFEALVFVEPAACLSLFGGDSAVVRKLEQIRRGFRSPEEIDEGPTTAPSKRLLSVLPSYQKPFHGPLAAGDIGLAKIRVACAHFATWLAAVEAL